jgi:hypothetical protein
MLRLFAFEPNKPWVKMMGLLHVDRSFLHLSEMCRSKARSTASFALAEVVNCLGNRKGLLNNTSVNFARDRRIGISNSKRQSDSYSLPFKLITTPKFELRK